MSYLPVFHIEIILIPNGVLTRNKMSNMLKEIIKGEIDFKIF